MNRVLSLLIPVLLNQNLVSSDVTDYRITTWNSEGYKLDKVFDLLDKDKSLNLVLVQECGNIADKNPGSIINPPVQFIMIDGENEYDSANDGNYEIREYRTRSTQLFIYYFPAPKSVNQQFGLAIVTKQLASEILYFASLHNHREIIDRKERSFINRPIVGLVFGTNDIFLNFHAEPTRNNEVLLQLNAIKTYMSRYKPNASWMLGADFNREPGDVTLDPHHERLIHPSQNTRRNRIIDYFIYGSANRNVFARMAKKPHTTTINAKLVSDHKAVDFNPAPRG
ncbi:uncharacterized protein Dana_GF26441 [Drosophila ananassae]|uniref:Endonuclease/exonuclease/phosphatase domain-containing protein n=1 Tax=Drosophila ananassae TaxID=7217 RepID=A0A0P8XEH8_DROAN|nr:cytolethal distending toxin subunit B [Drosophila ananassae]KPU72928.1 uncharacterized protein Dana_GF26441 [Drosophila ananassae]QDH44042.1 cytolethal distending toxin B [synthetic construct]